MALDFSGAGTPLTANGLAGVLATVGAPATNLWAVLAVETSGCGFLPDRRPKILFERHIFARLTGHHYDVAHPEISGPRDPNAYGARGAHQYDRLAIAIGLDRNAALQSASWGLGQIMGENHVATGFADAESMVAAFAKSEDDQLEGMAAFIAANGMKPALAGGDWAGFASRYNGPSYAANDYDGKLKTFNATYTANGCPDIDVRAAQVLMTYLNYPVHGIDGQMGPNTRQALQTAQAALGVPVTGAADAATLAALSAAVAAL
jgi:hypothetical protein